MKLWMRATVSAVSPGTLHSAMTSTWSDSAGSVYVGYAAHCAGTGGQTDTNGCDTGSVPLGTTVDFTNDGNLLEVAT